MASAKHPAKVAIHPVKPFAGRSRPSSALHPEEERTAQVGSVPERCGKVPPVARDRDERHQDVAIRRMQPVRLFEQRHCLTGRTARIQRDRVDIGAGVPTSGWVTSPSSITSAFSYLRIKRITRLGASRPGLRVHLIGHSFGARLVSFALAGLPERTVGATSPVKSLLLLQGAFSHFAFADALPFDAARGGAVRGMGQRVGGPLVTTHTLLDTAVGRFYPLASVLARQDAARLTGSAPSRWGAFGNDGAQAVNALEVSLAAVGTKYAFAPGVWPTVSFETAVLHPARIVISCTLRLRGQPYRPRDFSPCLGDRDEVCGHEKRGIWLDASTAVKHRSERELRTTMVRACRIRTPVHQNLQRDDKSVTAATGTDSETEWTGKRGNVE